MKRTLAAVAALALCLLLAAGCTANQKEDSNTLTITVPPGRVDALLTAMQEEFPQLRFDISYNVCDNDSGYLNSLIRSGGAGDLIFYTQFTSIPEDTSQMLDLSGYPLVGNIHEDVLHFLDVGGAIYQVPGPLDVRCIAYNKTMFEEQGWSVPQSFAEQIGLIRQIRTEQPEVVPLAYPALPGFSIVLLGTYSQAGFLSSPAGYGWQQDWFAGTASFGTGMDEGFSAVEQLIAADAFEAERYVGKWNCHQDVLDRKAAMYILWGGVDPFFQALEDANCTDEFGLIPFYGQNEGESVVGCNTACVWSINKKLGEAGREEKLKNALQVMEWILSAEGQALMQRSRGQIPVTKNGAAVDPRLEELMEHWSDGFWAPGIYSGYEHTLVEVGTIVQDAILARSAEGLREAATKAADDLNREFTENRGNAGYTYLDRTLTEAETSQLMANILYDSGLGDFALITHTGLKDGVINGQGCGGRLFRGGVTENQILIINANRNMHLTTLELTKAEITALLETGKGLYRDENRVIKGEIPAPAEAETLPQTYFAYQWAGLEVSKKDGKVQSLRLDGKALSDAETYTVIFAERDYPRIYMDRAQVSDILVSDAMIAYFEKSETLTPPEVLGN